jgi:hypothetical protein
MITSPPSVRFYVIAFLIIALFLWIVVRYARLLKCHLCKAPYAVFARSCGDLCWSCAGVFDKNVARAARRRSLLRRIWRTAT